MGRVGRDLEAVGSGLLEVALDSDRAQLVGVGGESREASEGEGEDRDLASDRQAGYTSVSPYDLWGGTDEGATERERRGASASDGGFDTPAE